MLRSRLLSIISLVVLLSSCAQIVPPQGGPNDTAPPEIVYTNFKDSMLLFSLEELVFKFDEVIQTSGQVVEISPLIDSSFTSKAKHKTLTIDVPLGALAPKTTYSITIQGVQDVTEQNKLPTRTYILSTGNYLDSLSITGRVLTSENNATDTAASVYLYRAEEGIEAVRKKKPAFLAPVSGSGMYRVNAIPPGTYRLFALGDLNKNYLYDNDDERIGFDTNLYVLGDSTLVEAKTIFTWVATSDSMVSQTSTKVLKNRMSGAGMTLSVDTTMQEAQQDIYRPLEIGFGYPVDTFYTDLISCTDTTSQTVLDLHIELDSLRKTMTLMPDSGWTLEHGYKIYIKEGAINDSSGWESSTGYFYFTALSADDYSTLLIHFTPLDSSHQYVCTLLLADQRHEYILNSNIGFDIYKAHVTSSDAQLEYYHDANRNKKRDIGDLKTQQQPEVQQKAIEPMTIKKGWDHVYTIEAHEPGKHVSRKTLEADSVEDPDTQPEISPEEIPDELPEIEPDEDAPEIPE